MNNQAITDKHEQRFCQIARLICLVVQLGGDVIIAYLAIIFVISDNGGKLAWSLINNIVVALIAAIDDYIRRFWK